MKFSSGALKQAIGENSNPFYQTEKTAQPIISAKATITPPDLKKTFVYDIATQAGKVYTLVAE